jgi:DNA-binding NtrC family response regulator
MRPQTRLLWIRTDAPGPEEIDLLQKLGDFIVHVTNSPHDALERVRIENADMVLAEFPLPGWEPAELLERIQEISLRIPVLILDPAGTVADAIRLVKLGAYHFMTILEHNDAIGWLEMAAEKWRLRTSAIRASAAAVETWKHSFAGESRAVRNIEHVIRLVGPKRATVLITGETGTGKEVVARALHQASPRAHLPMVAVNCSALPEALLEAELFGHVKGAFTGAMHQRVGRFEQAQNSTLFLDEIGEMPIELQAKLLRVLQEREFQRIGSSETVRIDVRIIAASNQNLQDKVHQGTFREDLFYRLNVVPIEMPPLRERAADIPLLVHYFLEKICALEGIPVKRITREALDRLSAYCWPGNIRQLQNAVEMAIVLSEDCMDLCPADFRLPSQQSPRIIPAVPSQATVPDGGLDFDLAVANFERSLLEQAVERSGGNKTLAADLLRMKRTTLLAKLRNLESRRTVISNKSA